MKVYEIIHDPDKYQCLVDDERSKANEVKIDSLGKGKAFKGKWVVPKLRIYNPFSKKPNFYSYISGATVVDEKTCEIFQSIFEMAGELFQVKCDSFDGYILNILECINCLDHENCEFELDDDGNKLWINKFGFQSSMFSESTIFKIPEAKTSIFIIEGLGIREEFKEVYDKNKMKGLKFELVWSDEKNLKHKNNIKKKSRV